MKSKTKNRKKNFFKGAALATALAFTALSTPINAFTALAEDVRNADWTYMTIGNSTSLVPTTVRKDAEYKVPVAYIGGVSDFQIGKVYNKLAFDSNDDTKDVTIVNSSITLKYGETLGYVENGTTYDAEKNVVSGDKVVIDTDGFIASKQGTYTVTYSYDYTVGGVTYTNSYDLTVESQLSDAEISISSDGTAFLPSLIDISQLKGELNLYLPAVEVKDEDGNEVEDITMVTSSTEMTDDKNYVLVTARNSNGNAVKITKNDESGKYYIAKADFQKDGQDQKDTYFQGNYTIKYSYYSGKNFITSVSKTVKLCADYYKSYELIGQLDSSWTDKGTTGVSTDLPTASGVTSTKSTPASEAVDTTYSVKVLYGKSTSDTKTAITSEEYGADVVDAEGNLVDPTSFKPLKDGTYTFVYTVKDVYGNSYTFSEGVHQWTNVTDTEKPTPIVYDASDVENVIGYKLTADTKIDDTKTYYTKSGETYTEVSSPDVTEISTYYEEYVERTENKQADASSKLKTYSYVDSAVVVYAIGLDDNVSTDSTNGVVLTREIKNSGSNVVCTIKDEVKDGKLTVANKNLIFNYTSYTDLITNNYLIEKQCATVSNEAEMLAWLIDNNYVIVVDNKNNTNLNNIFGKEDVTKEAGFYYVDMDKTFGASTSKNGVGTGTYYIHYIATDASGNKQDISKSMSIQSFEDKTAPDITFSTSLKTEYKLGDEITFSKPTATDSGSYSDSRMTVRIAYRYLDDAGKVVAVKNEDGEDINDGILPTDDLASDLQTKYSAYFGANADGYVDITDSKDSSLTIKTSEVANATQLQIVAYVYDDAGNAGFYGQTIKLKVNKDVEAPTYKEAGEVTGSYAQGQEVTLPSFVVCDDQVPYLTYDVKVLYKDEENTTEMSVVDSSFVTVGRYNINTGKGSAKLNAGKITASYAGEYTVEMAVKDANNNIIVAFTRFTTSARTVVQEPTFQASLESQTVELDDQPVIDIPTPTISYENAESTTYDVMDTSKKYVVNGVDKDGKATNWQTTYGTHDSFAPTKVGTYKIKYTVNFEIYNQKLIQYNDADTSSDVPYYSLKDNKDIKISLKDDGNYQIGNYTYNVTDKKYYDSNDIEVDAVDIDASLNGIELDKEMQFYSMTSDTYTITVKDTTGPVINNKLEGDDYMSVEDLKNNGIVVKGIEATDNGSGVDMSKSSINVAYNRISGNSGSQTIENNGGTYKVSSTATELDGTYTVTYKVYDNNGNYSTKSFTYTVGDNENPTITVASDFASASYKLGEKLEVDTQKLTFADNKSDADKVGSTVKLTLKNDSTGDEIECEQIGSKYSFEKFNEVGTYTLTIEATDEVGNKTTKDISIEVSSESKEGTTAYQVVGTILIVVSVIALIGVIVYFVVAKVKLDKELKK